MSVAFLSTEPYLCENHFLYFLVENLQSKPFNKKYFRKENVYVKDC